MSASCPIIFKTKVKGIYDCSFILETALRGLFKNKKEATMGRQNVRFSDVSGLHL